MANKISGQSIGAKIRAFMVAGLVAILALAFAVWGIEDALSPQSSRAVASIGKTDVMADEFERAFKRELEARARQNGVGLSHEEAFAQGVHSQVLGGMIQDAVIALDADELGIGVNRRITREQIGKLEIFQDELTGEFSEQKLDSILAQNRVTRAEFEKDVLRDLRRAQSIPAVVGGVEAPAAFGEQRFRFLTEQRRARVLTLTRDAVAEPAEPDDATVQSFIAGRANAFTAPEYRRFTMIRLENFDLTPDIEVDEEALKGAFDYRVELGELGSPETRSLVQIIANDEATAKKAAELLATDQDPAVIASGLGLIEPDSYDNVLRADIIDPETARVAFEAQDGEIRTILGSLGQWYAVKVTGITAAVVPDFDAMRDELERDLLDQYAQEKLFEITGEIEDAMDEGLNFEEIAARLKLPLQSIDFIDRLGLTQDGVKMSGVAYIKGVAEDDLILTEIFIRDIGFETDLFETTTNGYAAIRVDDVINSTLRPFEEVKEQATAMWKTVQIDEALQAKMLEVAASAQSGTSLDDIAASMDGASVEDVILMRSAPNDQIGPALQVKLLEAEKGNIERGEGAKPLTRQVAELTMILANNDGLAGEYADIIQEQSTIALRSDIQQAYQNAILSKNPLVENPAKIRSVLGLDPVQ